MAIADRWNLLLIYLVAGRQCELMVVRAIGRERGAG
jgi:hypothetical protein